MKNSYSKVLVSINVIMSKTLLVYGNTFLVCFPPVCCSFGMFAAWWRKHHFLDSHRKTDFLSCKRVSDPKCRDILNKSVSIEFLLFTILLILCTEIISAKITTHAYFELSSC